VKPYIPASFSALLISTLIVKIFHIKTELIGNLPRNVISWTPIHNFHLHILTLIYPALAIALLSSIEALLAARVADELMKVPAGSEFRPNQELFGQGVATLFATLTGGMPSTGAIARTNVNVRSHANSRIAAMSHAVFLLIITIFLAPLFGQIPKAAIAGVLIGTSFRIFNKSSLQKIFIDSRANILVFLVTGITVISVDLIWGIAVGVCIYAISRVPSYFKSR
jgi:SulP family sulfate permease